MIYMYTTGIEPKASGKYCYPYTLPTELSVAISELIL